MHDKKKKSISKNSTSSLVPPSRNVSLTEQAALLSPASSLEIAQERSIFHIPSFLPLFLQNWTATVLCITPPFLPPFSSGIVIPLYCGSGMSPVKSWTSHVAGRRLSVKRVMVMVRDSETLKSKSFRIGRHISRVMFDVHRKMH